jgi:hypothetical protein
LSQKVDHVKDVTLTAKIAVPTAVELVKKVIMLMAVEHAQDAPHIVMHVNHHQNALSVLLIIISQNIIAASHVTIIAIIADQTDAYLAKLVTLLMIKIAQAVAQIVMNVLHHQNAQDVNLDISLKIQDVKNATATVTTVALMVVSLVKQDIY